MNFRRNEYDTTRLKLYQILSNQSFYNYKYLMVSFSLVVPQTWIAFWTKQIIKILLFKLQRRYALRNIE